eukprot:30931-Pelagococcus_subviridis.AAC.15
MKKSGAVTGSAEGHAIQKMFIENAPETRTRDCRDASALSSGIVHRSANNVGALTIAASAESVLRSIRDGLSVVWGGAATPPPPPPAASSPFHTKRCRGGVERRQVELKGVEDGR